MSFTPSTRRWEKLNTRWVHRKLINVCIRYFRTSDAIPAGTSLAVQRSRSISSFRLFSVLFGGGTSRQFAKKPKQRRCGFLIGETLERNRRREMRRFRVKADADEVLVAPRSQGVHDRAQFHRPIFFRSENHRSRMGDGPGACAFFRLRSGLPRPAMADDIEMKSRRKAHIGFESKRLLLLTPSA